MSDWETSARVAGRRLQCQGRETSEPKPFIFVADAKLFQSLIVCIFNELL